MTQLQLLLQNLYNAPWPKDFNPDSFVKPTEDLEVIMDSREINGYNYDDEQMQNMAKALIHENKEIANTVFYRQWVSPIETYFRTNKIPLG